MNWFDEATDAERTKILAFTIGFLNGAAKYSRSETEKYFALDLLNAMEGFATNIEEIIGEVK